MMEELRGFAGFPCLIFPASRSLGADAAGVKDKLNAFLLRWESHGSPVNGCFTVLENRFVAVAHRPIEISGCSRDDLLFFMRDLGGQLGVEWLGAARIFYRDSAGQIQDVDRIEFKRRAREGLVGPDTVVFDTTVRETNALLEGRFALPAAKSWHARLMETVIAA